MNIFLKWIIKNLSNIFGLFGILLTLYFGVYYVPNWLRESQNERILNSQRNLEQSIKELVYSDSLCNYSEIEVLIRAKEISLKEKYPYSPKDILTQVQESFMQDRFLPLEKRKNLISELEVLKSHIPTPIDSVYISIKTKKSTLLLEWLSIVLSIAGVLAGVISFFLKFRTEKNKQEEIENQIIEADFSTNNIENAYEFEKSIIKEIENYPGVSVFPNISGRDIGCDLQFYFNDKAYFVEIKYLTRSKIGLNSFQRFIAHQKGLEGEFWFIYNTGLTEMVKQKAEEINKLTSPVRINRLINAESSDIFKRQLNELLPTTMAHTQ